eukprot:TRINITY_DN8397_c0_g1_i2.p1 TRINITY_DN8397_c0_g1~~TRINITY_DN8397_c0_g1_i2.p1  ORF type:complete len:697 (+),score=170.09 TRINITY_DN8397_c0_g1_i2:126-2216(+)
MEKLTELSRIGLSRTHYEVLGVARNAEPVAIKKAYHKLSLLFHPDKSPELDGETFKRVKAAYEVLGSPDERNKYDMQLLAPHGVFSMYRPPPPPTQHPTAPRAHAPPAQPAAPPRSSVRPSTFPTQQPQPARPTATPTYAYHHPQPQPQPQPASSRVPPTQFSSRHPFTAPQAFPQAPPMMHQVPTFPQRPPVATPASAAAAAAAAATATGFRHTMPQAGAAPGAYVPPFIPAPTTSANPFEAANFARAAAAGNFFATNPPMTHAAAAAAFFAGMNAGAAAAQPTTNGSVPMAARAKQRRRRKNDSDDDDDEPFLDPANILPTDRRGRSARTRKPANYVEPSVDDIDAASDDEPQPQPSPAASAAKARLEELRAKREQAQGRNKEAKEATPSAASAPPPPAAAAPASAPAASAPQPPAASAQPPPADKADNKSATPSPAKRRLKRDRVATVIDSDLDAALPDEEPKPPPPSTFDKAQPASTDKPRPSTPAKSAAPSATDKAQPSTAKAPGTETYPDIDFNVVPIEAGTVLAVKSDTWPGFWLCKVLKAVPTGMTDFGILWLDSRDYKVFKTASPEPSISRESIFCAVVLKKLPRNRWELEPSERARIDHYKKQSEDAAEDDTSAELSSPAKSPRSPRSPRSPHRSPTKPEASNIDLSASELPNLVIDLTEQPDDVPESPPKKRTKIVRDDDDDESA